MVEEYDVDGVVLTKDELITLREAILQNSNPRYNSKLDLNTLGYVESYQIIGETEFIPMTFNGKFLKFLKGEC